MKRVNEWCLKDNVLVESVQIIVDMYVKVPNCNMREKIVIGKSQFDELKNNEMFRWQIADCARLAYSKAFDNRAGYVYILYAPEINMCKIGFTRNEPSGRMLDIGAKLPFDVELAYAALSLDPKLAETRLHDLFKDKRKRGEWFCGTPDDFKGDTASITMAINEEVKRQRMAIVAG